MHNTKFPAVVCSTILRDAQKGEEHGNIYVVDLETNEPQHTYSFTDDNIDWEGRGGERGLRGIAFYGEYVIVAATNSILFFDTTLGLVRRVTNPYLSSNHEICVSGNLLYISSTRYGAIIVYNLETEEFVTSYAVRPGWFMWLTPLMRRWTSVMRRLVQFSFPIWSMFWRVQTFDPNSTQNGPGIIDVLHLNNVFVKSGKIYFSGTTLPYFFSFSKDRMRPKLEHVIERQTHNPQVKNGKVLFNATRNDHVVVKDIHEGTINAFPVPRYDESELENAGYDAHKARQSFARGLTLWKDRYVVGGSSPATLSVYDVQTGQRLKSIQLSKDVREAIHGLELWPF